MDVKSQNKQPPQKLSCFPWMLAYLSSQFSDTFMHSLRQRMNEHIIKNTWDN